MLNLRCRVTDGSADASMSQNPQERKMDSKSFKQLIIPCYRRMMAVAMRMMDGDSDNAADAVQDTIATLWERRHSIDLTTSAEALCVTATRNRCISLIRARHLSASLDEVPQAAASDPSGTDVDHVRMAVNLLPENRRSAVTMSMRGFDNSEIAAEMRISEDNVRQLLSRGRRQLKEILSKI